MESYFSRHAASGREYTRSVQAGLKNTDGNTIMSFIMQIRPLMLIAAAFSFMIALLPLHADTPHTPFDIDISSVADWLGRMSPAEATDQMRDWAVFGLQARAGMLPDANTTFPIRNPRRKGFAGLPTGNGRISDADDDEWMILLDRATPALLERAGLLFDLAAARNDSLPSHLSVYEWSADASSRTIRVAPLRDLQTDTLRSDAAGYHEAAVSTWEELRQFLDSIDDLSAVSWKGGSLRLSGRKFRAGSAAALEAEDVAALYQAYNPPGSRTAPQVGFSLDPAHNNAGISRDLRAVAANQPGIIAPEDTELLGLVAKHAPLLTAAADAIERTRDVLPFIKLRRAAATLDGPDARRYEGLLASIEYRNAYQKARYDGNLRGTHAAMILFHTDLLAKLWALDYQGIFPEGRVEGFLPMARIPVARIYWDDFLKYSKTRLWFGLRKDAFFIDNTTLRFLPTATRVYAASSDPLYPGKETKPNRQSEQFLGWWDRHYQAVADHEPAYHRLNELQKWGCVFMACRELKVRGWEFLGSVPVARSLDFADWVSNNGFGDKPVSLPFIDRASLNEKNECLGLLRSADYPLMGRRFFLSGGVSLASAADIRSRIKAKAAGKKPAPASPAAAARKKAVTAGGKKPPAAPRAAHSPATARSADGIFSAARGTKDVSLSWKKSARLRMEEFVDDLAAAGKQEPDQLVRAKAGDSDVVCIERNKRYLIRGKDMNGAWMDVGVNLARKADTDTVLASGDQEDADIFSGVLISNKKARKMAGQ